MKYYGTESYKGTIQQSTDVFFSILPHGRRYSFPFVYIDCI